jgi:hypothetical protein
MHLESWGTSLDAILDKGQGWGKDNGISLKMMLFKVLVQDTRQPSQALSELPAEPPSCYVSLGSLVVRAQVGRSISVGAGLATKSR